MEISEEACVQDAPSGDPAPLLWTITLPVNQVLESTAPRYNLQEVPHRVRRLAINETGERGGPGKRRQRAVRHRFNPRHMKVGMYTQRESAEELRNLEMGKGLIKRGKVCGTLPKGAERMDSHNVPSARDNTGDTVDTRKWS